MAVSVKDVARLAGVSVGTVSNVLNHPAKVSDETITRVNNAIDKLGFIRNDAARQLRAGSSRAIGLLILDVRNPFFTDVARGAEARAAESGHVIVLGNSDESSDRESDYLDLFEQQRVRGLLISPVGDVTRRLHRLRDRGISSVLVDRPSPDEAFASVFVDDVAGGELAARHLLELGRRRLAFVGGPTSIRQVSDRLAGARTAAAEQAGASLEVITTAGLSVHDGAAAAATILARPARERPDAVFAANDLLAIGLLQVFVSSSTLRVPDDLALVGYDDIGFAGTAIVPLTSVRQPAQLIGATAVDLLLAETAATAKADAKTEPDQTRAVRYLPELVVRASTAS